MPLQTIKVRFLGVYVRDDSDFWGSGEWKLHATVDGRVVGNPSQIFEARRGEMIVPRDWTTIVDVSNHTNGDKIEIRLSVKEDDVFSDDELGEVKATLKYPYVEPDRWFFLQSPKVGGKRYYDFVGLALHHDQVASTNATGATRIPVTRTSHGGSVFNTVRGDTFTPRVDVHPVIPVPQPPSHVVRPVRIPTGMAPAQVTPAAQVAAAPAAPNLNALVNPSVIPILSASDPNLATRVAKLSITAYEPGNLDTSKFFWKVASGPAAIVGANTGLSIQARGTGSSSTDQLAVFEVHWENQDGPLLAKYRAWVGKLGTLRYRVNILNGMVDPSAPSGTPAPFQTATLMPPATVQQIMQTVQAIVYQAGLLLLPDTNTTCWEGATLTGAGNAIFQTTVTNNQHTNNVSHQVLSASTRYNFRPGVINFAVVFSTSAGNAAAVERNGIEGSADSAKSMGGGTQYSWTGNGVEKSLGGSPSTSWIKPAGVGRDGQGVSQKMETIQPTDRVKQAKSFDKDFVTARKAADPSFTANHMGQLYSAQIPARWCNTVPNYVWNCGINIAHELCHVLGLAHRGSGGNSTGPSTDKMDFTDSTGAQRGHPWHENIMTYGYVNINPPRAHDIDLLQAMVVRRHPAISYP